MVKTCLCLYVLGAGSSALAAHPIAVFPAGPGSTIEDRAQRWHEQLEEEDDYSESWFFFVHTSEGHALLASVSITNLGLSTFDGVYSFQFYDAQGTRHGLYKEVSRGDIRAATDKLDMTLGKSRLWRDGSGYHLTVTESGVKLVLHCQNVLAPTQFGNGQATLDDDATKTWHFGLNTPRGAASGHLSIDGKTYSLSGQGYHDHSWSTVKLPAFLDGWFTLRVFDSNYTIVLHQQQLSEDFGRGTIQFGVLGTDKKKLGGVRKFRYQPSTWRKDPASKRSIPTAFDVAIESGGYTVRGTVREERFLDSIDVLAHLSWPVRTLVKVAYKPYLIRYWGRYDLEITDPQGKLERIVGSGLVETNYF